MFDPQRDIFPKNPCPYNDDGNPEMYTAESIEEREKLKKNPTVREAITEFINTEFQANAQGQYTKEEYLKVFMKLGTILRPNIDADDL